MQVLSFSSILPVPRKVYRIVLEGYGSKRVVAVVVFVVFVCVFIVVIALAVAFSQMIILDNGMFDFSLFFTSVYLQPLTLVKYHCLLIYCK